MSPIHLIEDDFAQITLGGKLLDHNGEFRSCQFQTMMRKELLRFAQVTIMIMKMIIIKGLDNNK